MEITGINQTTHNLFLSISLFQHISIRFLFLMVFPTISIYFSTDHHYNVVHEINRCIQKYTTHILF